MTLQSVTNLLVARLREAEDEGEPGMKQGELIAWYMDHIMKQTNLDSNESTQQVNGGRCA